MTTLVAILLAAVTPLYTTHNTVDGEEIYFIPNPALGLWINREAFK